MADRKEYLNNYAKNYTTARITFRKDSVTDQEIMDYLDSKPNVSSYLKDIIRKEMERSAKEEKCLRLAGMRSLEELIDEIPGCYTIGDVQRKLDAMNTSREIMPLDWDGMAQNYVEGSPEFLQNIARPDLDGTAMWFGVARCGKYDAIMRIYGVDWDDEEQMFLNEGAEIIGWR